MNTRNGSMNEFSRVHRVVAVLGVALLHFIATLIVLFASFRGERFDRGVPTSLLEEILGVLLHVLTFPLINPISRFLPRLPTVMDYGVVLLNSLLWGVAILWIVSRFWRASAST